MPSTKGRGKNKISAGDSCTKGKKNQTINQQLSFSESVVGEGERVQDKGPKTSGGAHVLNS